MTKNNKWEALSLRDRAFLMRESVKNGITNLNEIRDLYNQSHQFGGEEDKSPYIGTLSKKVITKTNNVEHNDVDYENFWKVLKNISTAEDAPHPVPKIKLHNEWLRPIDDEIPKGVGYLYDPKFYEKHKVLKDKVYNEYYYIDDSDNNIEIPEDFEVLPKDKVRKLLPPRDYIGGTKAEVRDKVAQLIPGLLDSINAISARHGVSPDIMHRRLGKEGYYDKKAQEYNYGIYKDEMPNYWKTVADKEVNGFTEMGLDDAGELLLKGQIKLTKPISWETLDATNEKGRNVTSVIVPNLWDALEVKAGDIKYRQEEMRKRGIPDEDLNTWVNASYNLGINHEDLEDKDWIRKEYKVPDYSYLLKK